MSTWEQLDTSGMKDPQIQRKELEAKQKKEEEERRRKAQQQKQQKQQAEAKRKRQTFNPIEVISQPFKPAMEALDKGLEQVQEGVGEFLGQPREVTKQKRAKGKQFRQQLQTRIESNKGPAAEAVRAVVGAVPTIAEGLIDTSVLVVDTAATGATKLVGGKRDPKRNPFSAEYVYSDTNFGNQKPKTVIGNLGMNLLAFGMTGIAAARRLPEASLKLGTSGKGLKGAIASGVIPGAIADFLLSKPNDATLSNIVQELAPESWRDSLMFALAADEEDNAWTARIKAVVEGAAVGAVADAALWTLHGRRVSQAALRAGRSEEEAVTAGLEAMSAKKQELEAQSLENATTETYRWTEAQEAEMRQLNMEEADFQRSIEEARQSGIPDEDPTMQVMQQRLAELELSKVQLEQEVIAGYRPDSQDLLHQERAASNSVGDVNKAAVQQDLLTDGPLPQAARRPGVTEADSRGNQPAYGGSERILTDANYRLMNMDNNAEQVVRDIEQRVDLQNIAAQLKTTDEAVVAGSAKIVEDFRRVFDDTEGPTPDIVEFLKQRGATQLLTNEQGVGDRILTREGVVAMKTIIAQTAEDIYALAKASDDLSSVSMPDGNQFDRMLDRLESMVTLVKVTGNKFGGGLRSFGLTNPELRPFSGDDPAEELLTVGKMKEWANRIRNLRRTGDPSAADEIRALTRAMALAGGDPAKTVKFSRLVASMGWKEAMGIFYNSIFSGPISHLRNAMGSSFSLLERPTAIMLKGILGADDVSFRAAMAGYRATYESVFEAWRAASMTFKTGDPLNGNDKFIIDDMETRAMLQRLNAVAETDSEQRAVGFVNALYNFNHNKFFSWPIRTLTASDDFFKTLIARQEIKMRSTVASLTDPKFATDPSKGFEAYFNHMSRMMDPTTGRILDKSLLEIAERGTFQQDPGNGIKYLSKMLEAWPALKLLVPIIRTPANLIGYGSTHMPGINLFIKEAREALMQEAVTPAQMLAKADYEGRMAIGSFAVAAAALVAFNDNLTGYGPPPNSGEREAWLLEYQPQSLRIGGKWVSYAGIEPLASIMAVAADSIMLSKMGMTDAAERVLTHLSFSIASGLTDKSFLAGLSVLAEVLDPEKMLNKRASQVLLNTANNFIPLAGARRALYNTIQPMLMEVDGELQRMLNVASGGLVIQGATRVDPLTGKESPSFAGGWYNAVSPVRIMPAGEDPVKEMLHEINFKIPRNISGLHGVELTAKDKNELNRTMFQLGLRERLEAAMQTEAFQDAVKRHDNRAFDPNNPDQMPPHYRTVWSIWNGVRQNAMELMGRQNMDFRTRVLQSKQMGTAARRGDYDAIQDILKTPK